MLYVWWICLYITARARGAFASSSLLGVGKPIRLRCGLEFVELVFVLDHVVRDAVGRGLRGDLKLGAELFNRPRDQDVVVLAVETASPQVARA